MGTGYRLGEWTVRPHRNRIERGDESVHLAPKAMAVLKCLAEASNSVVTRHEIFDDVWPGAAVSDEVLTQRIAELRKAFGESARQPKIVETIPKIGFRIIPPVIPLPEIPVTSRLSQRILGSRHALKWLVSVVVGFLLLVLSLRTFWMDTPTFQESVTSMKSPVIAVLPFVNMSEDPGNEYFSDGISEELISLLAQVPDLHVISRSSSFSFKGENWKMADLARELNADLIMEGTVRKVDNQVRITAQLIDTSRDEHLFAESFDRELSDIFLLQEEIAQAIVNSMRNEIGTYTVIVEQPTENMEAYELFLQGRHKFHQRGTMLDSAIVLLRMAVEEDPEFAEAWAYLAAAATVACFYHTSINNDDAYRVAMGASEKALDLDPEFGLVSAVQAMLLWHYDGNLKKAFLLLDRAVAEDPRDATVRLWVAMFYGAWGYREKALYHYEIASRNDPRVGITHGMLGLSYLNENREHLAARHFRKATELGSPLHIFAQASWSMMRDETEAAFALLKSVYVNPTMNPSSLAWVYELEEAGRSYVRNSASRDELISVIERAPGGVTDKSNLFLFFNLKDQFFDYFALSVKESHFWPTFLFPTLWLLEYRAYIEDPRFFELMSWDGAVELWEQRGFPDGCNHVSALAGDRLDCSLRYQ